MDDFVFYRDVFGGWRWEWRDAQGHFRDSQHSYDTREECVEAASRVTLPAGAGHTGPRDDERKER